FLFVPLLRPPTSTLLPYTTLFRSLLGSMDRLLYQALFSFGQRDLTAVDELNRDEWQQHLQQLGAVGSAQWDQLIDQYQKQADHLDRKSTRLNSSHVSSSYAVFCLK